MNNKHNKFICLIITGSACTVLAACSTAGKTTSNLVTLTGQPNGSNTGTVTGQTNASNTTTATGQATSTEANTQATQQTSVNPQPNANSVRSTITERPYRRPYVREYYEGERSGGVHVNLPGVHVNSNRYGHGVHIKIF